MSRAKHRSRKKEKNSRDGAAMIAQTIALSVLLPLTVLQLTLLSLVGLLLLPIGLLVKSYRRHLAREIEREIKNVEAVVSESGEQIKHLGDIDRAVLKARMTIVKLKGGPDA